MRKKRREGNEDSAVTVQIQVILPPVDLAPSTIDTNVAVAVADCIPSGSIGVSQESIDARTATKTMVDTIRNTDDGDIYPPVGTVAALGF